MLIEKLKKHYKKIILGLILCSIGYIFFPFLNVLTLIWWDKVNRGVSRTLKDYYYTNIVGITSIKGNLVMLLTKPYMFNDGYAYIYFSSDLETWKEVYINQNVYWWNSPRLDSNNADLRISRDGTRFSYDPKVNLTDKDSGYRETIYLPKEVDGQCYIFNFFNGLKSENCKSNWHQFTSVSQEVMSKIQHSSINVCDYANMYLDSNNFALISCKVPYYPKVNMDAYNVLERLNQTHHLGIKWGVAHTTYNNNIGYIGVFLMNGKYYFLLSRKGNDYKIVTVSEFITTSIITKLLK